LFSFHVHATPSDLPSFPTRRSSDLSEARTFGALSIRQGLQTSLLNVPTFFLEASRIVGNHTQVPLGALDLLDQPGGGKFARNRDALLATDGFIQEHDCVFETNQTRARIFDRLLGHRQLSMERFRARF